MWRPNRARQAPRGRGIILSDAKDAPAAKFLAPERPARALELFLLDVAPGHHCAPGGAIDGVTFTEWVNLRSLRWPLGP